MKPLLLPMLAIPAAPFDAEEYLFEVKWDGVRALAAVEAGHGRLWGRHGTDYTARYPELAVLSRLPSGTVLDGELVVLHGGRADFPALLSRHQRRRIDPLLPPACHQPPACYVVFDLLFSEGQSLLQEALVRRRARLRELLLQVNEPVLAYSEGVTGCGREFFAGVVAQGHEGVMAKRQGSRYWPGKRSPAWRKIKPAGMLPCVVIGYRADGEGVQCLLVATMKEGVLRYVGQLRAGLGQQARTELARQMAGRQRSRPLVPCPRAACWVEPERYCRVRFQGWTPHGHLRDAVFAGWISDPG
jgi:DNA ligase D-like protein (predicted ligase)